MIINRKIFFPVNPCDKERIIGTVLYPDDQSQQYAIRMLTSGNFFAVGILHDKDIELDENDKPVIDPDTGEVNQIKPHYHFLVRFKSARKVSKVAEELKIKTNYIEAVHDYTSAARYLLHKDHPMKFQYSADALLGSAKVKALEAMEFSSEGEKALEVIHLIDNGPRCMTVRMLIVHAARAGHWSTLRQGGQLFLKVLDEHNRGLHHEEPVAPNNSDSFNCAK